MRVFITILILFLIGTTLTLAQQDNHGWRIGVGGGYMNYYGDVSNYRVSDKLSNAFNLWHLNTNRVSRESVESRQSPLSSFSFTLERKLTPTTGFLFQYTNGYITGNDRLNLQGDLNTANPNFTRGLNFRTQMQDFSVGLLFSTDNDRFLPSNAFLAPYFTVNAGYTQFAVKGDLLDASGNRYLYNPDGTLPPTIRQDGNFETDLRQLNTEGSRYSDGAFNVGLGAGLKFRISSVISLHVQSDFRYAFTDYLDDVSGPYATSNISEFAGYAANPTGAQRGTRGDNKLNDIFAYHSVSVRFSLGRPRERLDYKAPVFNVASVPYDNHTAQTKDSTSADSLSKTAPIAGTTRPGKDTLKGQAGLNNKQDTISPIAASQAPLPASSDRETIITINDGRVQEIRVTNGNVVVRNLESGSTTGAMPDTASQKRVTVFSDTVSWNLKGRDIVAPARGLQMLSQPAANKKVIVSEKQKPASLPRTQTTPAPDSLRRPATQKLNNKTKNVQPGATLTSTDTKLKEREAAALRANDSAINQLNENITQLQIRLREIEKQQTASPVQTSQPARRTATFEQDSVYVSNTRQIEALRKQLDSQEKRKAPLLGNVFKSREEKQRIEAEKQQQEEERIRMMREINRLNDQIENRRTEYRQPAPQSVAVQPQVVSAEYTASVQQLSRYTDELKNALAEQRRLNEQLHQENQNFRRNQNNSQRSNARINRNERTDYNRNLRNNRQAVNPGTVVPVPVPLATGNGGSSDYDRQRLLQNDAQIKSLNQQIDSLQRMRAQTPDTAANNAQKQQLRALTDSIRTLQIRLETQRNTAPATVVNSEDKRLDVSVLPAVSVYFPTGTSRVSANGVKRLAQVATILNRYPDTQIVLTGMADATGNQAVNQKISRQRAQAIKTILVKDYRIKENRISIEAAGAQQASGSKNALDRRVEITFVQ